MLATFSIGILLHTGQEISWALVWANFTLSYSPQVFTFSIQLAGVQFHSVLVKLLLPMQYTAKNIGQGRWKLANTLQIALHISSTTDAVSAPIG